MTTTMMMLIKLPTAVTCWTRMHSIQAKAVTKMSTVTTSPLMMMTTIRIHAHLSMPSNSLVPMVTAQFAVTTQIIPMTCLLKSLERRSQKLSRNLQVQAVPNANPTTKRIGVVLQAALGDHLQH